MHPSGKNADNLNRSSSNIIKRDAIDRSMVWALSLTKTYLPAGVNSRPAIIKTYFKLLGAVGAATSSHAREKGAEGKGDGNVHVRKNRSVTGIKKGILSLICGVEYN